jgi:hypothetical protein
MVRDGGDGWRPWSVIPRVAGGAVSVPVVVGFVALGAAVLVARSLREVVREGWALVPSWRGMNGSGDRANSDAA